MIDYYALGRRIRARRRALNLTQEKLAEAADISASFLGHVERGTRNLSLETLLALCDALGASPDELLGYENCHLRLPEEWSEKDRQAVAELLRKAHASVK